MWPDFGIVAKVLSECLQGDSWLVHELQLMEKEKEDETEIQEMPKSLYTGAHAYTCMKV